MIYHFPGGPYGPPGKYLELPMPIFDTSFTVQAPLCAVAAFHSSTQALRQLTPPPIITQLRYIEPLGEGSRAEFTLWFGPFPVRWSAVHSQVDALHGFTDTQQSGPLATWQHTHHFTALDAHSTRVNEHIVYTYPSGWRGWRARLLFNPLALRFMFAYRAWVTRRLAPRV
jgi:ligand-binding SRPBCC domain-containing protein